MNESQRPGATQRAQTDSEAPQTPRLYAVPLLKRLLFTLVAPVGLALLLDWLSGTLPWITLAVALVCIPLASVVVGKAALRDFERVLAVVAPRDEPEPVAEGKAPESPAP